MVSSTKLVTDFNENVWGPLLDKTDEMDPTINVEQPTTFRELTRRSLLGSDWLMKYS